MTTQPGRQRQLLFKILASLLAVLVSVAAIELGLALFWPVPHSIAQNMYFEADPHTGYRLMPGGVGQYQLGIPAVANSHGHRDDEVALKKPEGTFRILVLGDSFTVGANVRQDEAYPQVLEAHLRSRYGPNIEVVNTGVGGWGPPEYAAYFEHYGRSFEPDLVLVGFFVGNDILASQQETLTAVLGQRVSATAAAQPFIHLQVFLYEHSNIARLLLNRGTVGPTYFVRKSCEDFSPRFLAIQKPRLPVHLRETDAARLAEVRQASAQIGRIKELAGPAVPVVVALLPDENQINPALQAKLLAGDQSDAYDFDKPQSMLRPIFAEMGIPTIDLLPAVLADTRCLFMNDTHLTPEGHELAAAVIADGLGPMLSTTMSAGTRAAP